MRLIGLNLGSLTGVVSSCWFNGLFDQESRSSGGIEATFNEEVRAFIWLGAKALLVPMHKRMERTVAIFMVIPMYNMIRKRDIRLAKKGVNDEKQEPRFQN